MITTIPMPAVELETYRALLCAHTHPFKRPFSVRLAFDIAIASMHNYKRDRAKALSENIANN